MSGGSRAARAPAPLPSARATSARTMWLRIRDARPRRKCRDRSMSCSRCRRRAPGGNISDIVKNRTKTGSAAITATDIIVPRRRLGRPCSARCRRGSS
jgi:hypothetical protein